MVISLELEQFIKNYNTEDIINAIVIMSIDSDPLLTDTNIPAAEWIASNAIRYNQSNLVKKFDLDAYNEMKQISSMMFVPILQEIFEEALKYKDDSDEIKQNLQKSMLMKLKNVATRGDAYQFQLMEMAEKLYQPFDSEFMKVYGFTFSCCERVFVYMYKRYMQILLGTHVDNVKIYIIQSHSFII
jgi:hypothetical protein